MTKTKLAAAVLSAAVLFGALSLPALAADIPFDDVDGRSWYSEAVAFAYANGLFLGTDTARFFPNEPMTRAEAAAVLSRAAEAEVGGYTGGGFDDVDKAAWYAPYIGWACENGAASGYGDGRFGPDDNVSRAQLAVMLANYVTDNNITLAAGDAPGDFADAGDIPDWALESVLMMQSGGVLLGDARGCFNPDSAVTRAEAAMAFMRMYKAMKKDCIDVTEQLFSIDAESVSRIIILNLGRETELTDREQISRIVSDVNAFRYISKETALKPDTSKGELVPPGLYGGMLIRFLDGAGADICSFWPAMASAQMLRADTETEIVNYYSSAAVTVSYEYFEKLIPAGE